MGQGPELVEGQAIPEHQSLAGKLLLLVTAAAQKNSGLNECGTTQRPQRNRLQAGAFVTYYVTMVRDAKAAEESLASKLPTCRSDGWRGAFSGTLQAIAGRRLRR
jgi:hypothetical protein